MDIIFAVSWKFLLLGLSQVCFLCLTSYIWKMVVKTVENNTVPVNCSILKNSDKTKCS